MECIICKKESELKFKSVGEVRCFLNPQEQPHVVIAKDQVEKAPSIYDCSNCHTRFVYPRKAENYEDVYKGELYKANLEFSKKLTADEDPAWSLLSRGYQYYVVLDYLKGKPKMSFLDVGCGWGSMTYALNKMGYGGIGIEVSDTAVQFSRETYGKYYSKSTLEEFKKLNPIFKFDLVFLLEVIEHVENPVELFEQALNFANKTLIVTTPDIDYFTRENPWGGEQPPIHLTFFSKKTMEYMADKYNLKLSFTQFPGKEKVTTLGAIFEK